MNRALSLIGVVLLAFLASALTVVGFLVSFRTFDSVNTLNASVPFYGFLMTTVGIGIAVAACRLAERFGAAKGVEGLIGFFLSFFGIPAFLSLIVSVWFQHKWPDGLPPAGLFWFALAILETMAVMVWLLVRDRRRRKAVVKVASQD